MEPHLAPSTFDNYERFSRLYIIPGLGSKRLDRLQVRDVQLWVNKISKECQCCKQGKDARRPDNRRRCCAKKNGICCKNFPSARMVRDIRNALRAALSHAITEELLTKNVAADATLPLPDICLNALRHRKTRQNAARQLAGAVRHDTDMVFTTQYGRPVEPRNFYRSFINRELRAGVRRISVHDARRTCGTLLADLDVHPRVAMRILRHADFKITMEIYTQVSSKKTRDALKRLGDSLDSPE